MRLSSLTLGGHIGDDVSALVDGQLPPAEEERAWNHVLGCPGCRRLVEYEGWTKTRIATLSASEQAAASPDLIGSLCDVTGWMHRDDPDHETRRRRTAAALLGVGSVGVALLGILAVTTPPAGSGEGPGSPAPALLGSRVGGPATAPGRVPPPWAPDRTSLLVRDASR